MVGGYDGRCGAGRVEIPPGAARTTGRARFPVAGGSGARGPRRHDLVGRTQARTSRTSRHGRHRGGAWRGRLFDSEPDARRHHPARRRHWPEGAGGAAATWRAGAGGSTTGGAWAGPQAAPQSRVQARAWLASRQTRRPDFHDRRGDFLRLFDRSGDRRRRRFFLHMLFEGGRGGGSRLRRLHEPRRRERRRGRLCRLRLLRVRGGLLRAGLRPAGPRRTCRRPGSVMPRSRARRSTNWRADDLFDRARRALQLDAVRALQQRQHFLAAGVEKLRDLVNTNCGQILLLGFSSSAAGRLPLSPRAAARIRSAVLAPMPCTSDNASTLARAIFSAVSKPAAISFFIVLSPTPAIENAGGCGVGRLCQAPLRPTSSPAPSSSAGDSRHRSLRAALRLRAAFLPRS